MPRTKRTFVETMLHRWGRWVLSVGPNPNCYSIQPFHPKAKVQGEGLQDPDAERMESLVVRMRKDAPRGKELHAALTARYATRGAETWQQHKSEFARIVGIRDLSPKRFYTRLREAKNWLENEYDVLD